MPVEASGYQGRFRHLSSFRKVITVQNVVTEYSGENGVRFLCRRTMKHFCVNVDPWKPCEATSSRFFSPISRGVCKVRKAAIS